MGINSLHVQLLLQLALECVKTFRASEHNLEKNLLSLVSAGERVTKEGSSPYQLYFGIG